MADPPPVSDDDLNAYIDGRLDPTRRSEVESALARDPALAAKLEAYKAQQAALRQLYDPVLEEPVPARLLETIGRVEFDRVPQAPRPRYLLRIAASLALLGVGAAAGWLASDYFASQDFLLQPIVRQATLAHKLAVVERAEGLALDKDDENRLSPAYIPANFGAPVRIPTLKGSNLTPVSLVSGVDANGARITVTYADGNGRRRTLFISKLSTGDDLPVKYRTDGGTPVLYWLDGPLVYVLVGDGDKEEMVRLAEEIYRSAAAASMVRSEPRSR